MRRSPAELWSALRSTYWLVPTLVTAACVGLSVALLIADPWLDLELSTAWTVLYPTTTEGARALLQAIIASMITVVSVTFSVAIVALTVASQHFGPRVLNSFMRDSAAQAVLGVFIGTFTYCVLVLQAVHGPGSNPEVPRLALGGALALVLLSVAALIFYVHHVASSLQVSNILAAIAEDLESSLSRVVVTKAPSTTAASPGPEPEDVVLVPARGSGYMQSMDETKLATLLETRSAVGWVRRIPGEFLLAGAPMLAVSPPSAVDDRFVDRVNDFCVIGRDRTPWQDPEFTIKQLVEIALRALSPGVNEPFTAITSIDRLGQGLAHAARTDTLPPTVHGPAGQVRLVVPRQDFETLVRAAFDPIRMFAGHNPAIPARLLSTLEALGDLVTREEQRRVLRHQVEVIWRTTAKDLTDPDDRGFVEARYEAARAKLGSTPPVVAGRLHPDPHEETD